MSDTRDVYAASGLGGELALGSSPAVLVVDLSRGFTDSGSMLGCDLNAPVLATKTLLDGARSKGLPVVFTTIAFEPNLRDCGIWLRKGAGLAQLTIGSEWVEIDDRLEVGRDETVIVKKGASAFFGTNLVSVLVSQGVDCVILCGATTSGCVRATAVDLIQYGFPTIVPAPCVGDRAQEPHEANLFDIQAKYADVVGLDEALAFVAASEAAGP